MKAVRTLWIADFEETAEPGGDDAAARPNLPAKPSWFIAASEQRGPTHVLKRVLLRIDSDPFFSKGTYFTVKLPFTVLIFTTWPPPSTAPDIRMYLRGLPWS